MAKVRFPEKLNICFVANRFPLLGRAAHHGFIWPIARGLALKGHRVTVLSWRNPEGKKEIDQAGVKAYFLGSIYPRSLPPDFAPLVLRKFKELHQIEPFHLVHSFDFSGIAIGLDKRPLAVAMAYDIEATHMSQIFSVIAMSQKTVSGLIRTAITVSFRFLRTFFGRDRKVLKSADGMFVTTPWQRLGLERYYLYPEKSTYLVPYGIEIAELSPREKSSQLRQHLDIPEQAKVVVTVTDMTELEEMTILLRAFEVVAIKKPHSRLIVVGSGPLYKVLEFEMLSMALGSKVLFVGSVSSEDLPDYIALGDVYVNVSSRNSGYEPSQLEAMAQGKVVIGSEMSPLATVVEDGMDGFLIRPADVSSLASLMLHLFAEELPLKEIGERARQKVIDLFDNEKMVSATLEAYQSILIKTGRYRS